MGRINRVIDISFLSGPDDSKSIEYNPASGGQKSLIVGPRLLPIPNGTATWTTNVSAAAVALPRPGMLLAIYNNSGTAVSVTTGDKGVASQAIGAVDANGNVGVACPPNAWTYLSMGNHQYVISSAAAAIVYIIEDPTYLQAATGPYAQQNAPIQPIS